MRQWFLIIAALSLTAALIAEKARPGAAGRQAPDGGREILEDLRYQIDVWLLPGTVGARVTLRRLDSGRFVAEVTGRAQGFLGVISGQWQGAFRTEMILSQDGFLPVVYQEESRRRGKKNLNEYRFDYDRKVVELFKWDNGKQALTKRWQATLTEPMFDALSFYYNQRLKGLSFDGQGQTLRFPSIPYPKPEDIVLRIGPEEPRGRKIMVTLSNRIFENERNQVYALVDRDGVPLEAWTHVLRFGRITSRLVPGGKRLNRNALAAALNFQA